MRLPRDSPGGQQYMLIHEGLWVLIGREFRNRDFTSRQVAEIAGITERTALRHLWDFQKNGRVTVVGQKQRMLHFRIV